MAKKNISFNSKIFCSILVLTFFIFSLSFVFASELKVTEEHPFLINGSWISASELKVGDVLQTVDGKNVTIKKITAIQEENNFSVYNLEAGVYHNFVVCGEENCSWNNSGVVVHNSNVPTRNPHINANLRNIIRKSTKISTDSEGVEWIELRHYFLPDYVPRGQTRNLESLMKESETIAGSRPTSFLARIMGEKRVWGSVLEKEYIPQELLSAWLGGGVPGRGRNIIFAGVLPSNTRIGEVVFKMKYSDYKDLYSFWHINPMTTTKLQGSQYGSAYLSLKQGPLSLNDLSVNYDIPLSSFGTASEASIVSQLQDFSTTHFPLIESLGKVTLMTYVGVSLPILIKEEIVNGPNESNQYK